MVRTISEVAPRCLLPVESVRALHAEAVPAEVVMPARRTHQPAWRICLQPPLVLAPVPDPVLRPEHPPPAFAVEHGKISHRHPKGARLQVPGLPLVDEMAISTLGLREWIDGHGLRVWKKPPTRAPTDRRAYPRVASSETLR